MRTKSMTMEISHAYYLIIDLEATCSDNRRLLPRQEMEIIEIGAVMLNAGTLQVESEFESFIKPQVHPELTPFCKELTSITQSDVDSAPSYPDVMNQLRQWMAGYPDSVFCSWGDYDRKQFLQDCQRHHVDYPFENGHVNLKPEFSAAIESKKRFGLAAAIKHLKLDFTGTHHRGIDDARNITRIVQKIRHADFKTESATHDK